MFEALKGIVLAIYLSVAGLLGYVPTEEVTAIDASGDVEVVETPVTEANTFNQRIRLYDQYGVATDYEKDTTNVYYNNSAVVDADPNTFDMISGPKAFSASFGADKDNIFAGPHVLTEADRDTFVIGEGHTSSGEWFNAQDKNHKYAYEKIVE